MRNGVVGVGVIGTGFGSIVQAPGFSRAPGCKVVAIASSRKERAEAAARQLGIPFATDDYRALLARDDVDLVCISAPPYLHHEMTLAALAAGKHVLCEKPMAADRGQAWEMERRVRETGRIGLIDFELRCMPARAYMKELIDSGYLGVLYWVHATHFGGFRGRTMDDVPYDWLAQKKYAGGMLGAMGCHYVDAFRWWFGEVTGLYAELDTRAKARPLPGGSGTREADSDDTIWCSMKLDNGAMATLVLSAAVRHGPGARIEAYGSEGTLVLENDGPLFGARKGEARLAELPVPARLLSPAEGEDRRLRAFIPWARRVVDAVRQQQQITPDFHDGVRCQEVMDAIHRSSETRRWVGLPLESRRGSVQGGSST